MSLYTLRDNIKCIFLYILFFICNTSYAQLQQQDTLFRIKDTVTTNNSEFGGCFTPRGKLKILVIFCSFTNCALDPNNQGWPAGQEIPNWAMNDNFLFDSLSDFGHIPASNKSLSRYYYEMTKNLPADQQFKLYGDYLSVKIDTSGIGSFTDAIKKWDFLTKKAYEALEIKYPNLNDILSQYDNRTGIPSYKFDQSATNQPDGIIDYTVIHFRYSTRWHEAFIPDSPGGYARIEGYDFGNYKTSRGFVGCAGLNMDIKLYTHEIGHMLYSAPHYGNCNGILGKYLNTNPFWGMMPSNSGDNEILSGANAWERWFLGWINIKNDLSNSSDNGSYTLRDYFTTGDAIRIKLPYVDNQYIWLENHRGISVFDKRTTSNETLCGYPIPAPPTGLMVYIENISNSKSKTNISESGSNGIKLLDRQGNYDFFIEKYETRAEFCYNTLADFRQGLPNSYSGSSLSSTVLSDKNGDGELDYSNSVSKEKNYFIWVNDEFIYGNMASQAGFQLNDKIGMGTNPAIVNFQAYNTFSKKLDPIYLSGLSVEVISESPNGDLTVRVKFDDFTFENDIRMCGDIIFPPELITVNPSVDILIDKSGTPNRTTQRKGIFFNPSVVSTSANTYLKLFNETGITLNDESVFILKNNSAIEISNNSIFTVKQGCTFKVESGSNITVKGTGKIVIESGAYLCVENGANINLQDTLSVLNFHDGAILGINNEVMEDSGLCTESIDSIPYIGNGTINLFENDVYIQNETISSDRYISGKNIYVGSHVTDTKPQGDVVINNHAHIVFDAQNKIKFETGFKCENGSTFKIIK